MLETSQQIELAKQHNIRIRAHCTLPSLPCTRQSVVLAILVIVFFFVPARYIDTRLSKPVVNKEDGHKLRVSTSIVCAHRPLLAFSLARLALWVVH